MIYSLASTRRRLSFHSTAPPALPFPSPVHFLSHGFRSTSTGAALTQRGGRTIPYSFIFPRTSDDSNNSVFYPEVCHHRPSPALIRFILHPAPHYRCFHPPFSAGTRWAGTPLLQEAATLKALLNELLWPRRWAGLGPEPRGQRLRGLAGGSLATPSHRLNGAFSRMHSHAARECRRNGAGSAAPPAGNCCSRGDLLWPQIPFGPRRDRQI